MDYRQKYVYVPYVQVPCEWQPYKEELIDTDSFARARWIYLITDWYEAELGPANAIGPYHYPALACTHCGWPDLDVIPSPLPLHPRSMRKPLQINFSNRGLLIVDLPIFDFLQSLIGDEFYSGEAVIRGESTSEYRWLRPRHFIQRPMFYTQGDPCEFCGRLPTYNQMDYSRTTLFNGYGYSGNIALIGETPPYGCTRDPKHPYCVDEMWHEIAISGGLYAALHNFGAKGIDWRRSAIFKSNIETEPSWEEHRRFADLFPGRQDRFIRRKWTKI